MAFAKNVLGQPLDTCSCEPMTGFFRTGDCFTGPQDRGAHVVCSEMTAEFLSFSRARGNDLITPRPESDFPGLKPGDHWCLCATRWLEAYEAGCAPPVNLAASHEAALKIVPRAALMAKALKS
jgi:uncharacterized protein